MRGKIFFAVVAYLMIDLFVLALPTYARTKHCKGSAKLVGIVSETTVNLDDVPNHKIRLRVYIYDHTSNCQELAEFRQWIRAYDDIVGGDSRSIGYYTDDVKGGDKAFGKFNGKSKTEIKKEGSWEMVFSGEWEHTGGTGKFEQVRGKGTYAGKASPAGFSYEWEGDFEVPD